MGLESYGRFPLLIGPSPIQKLERLTKHLGGATLWFTCRGSRTTS